MDQRRQQAVGDSRHGVGFVNRQAEPERATGQQHRAGGVTAETEDEPAAAGDQESPRLGDAGQDPRDGREAADRPDVAEWRAFDVVSSAQAARAREAAGRAVGRSPAKRTCTSGKAARQASATARAG